MVTLNGQKEVQCKLFRVHISSIGIKMQENKDVGHEHQWKKANITTRLSLTFVHLWKSNGILSL